MGLYRTVSEINGDFSRKSQLFPPMVYLTPPLKGFPLELSNGAWGQKLEYNDVMGLSGRERSLTVSSSCLSVRHERDGQTDRQTDSGQTPADSKDRAYA